MNISPFPSDDGRLARAMRYVIFWTLALLVVPVLQLLLL